VGVVEESEVARHAARRIGSVLRGKYRIDRVLGVGGMAVVYAATHRNKKRFAVKMLHPELSLRDDIRTRFLREGYVANSVEHAGAVAVLDDDVAEDGAAFLVMELLEGAGVEQLWEKRGHALPARAVLALSDQLLDVLAAAHARSVVHRDIKPANVFLTRDGILKVLDFGIARLRDATSDQATQTGMTMGTPAYMAPEQAMGQSSKIDGLTDVWAVGATMFSLLSGSMVHLADNAQMLLVHAATQPARSLASAVGGVPAPVVEVVDRALAFDKGHRWQSATAMRDAVRSAYTAVFSAPLSPQPLLELFASAEAGPADRFSSPSADSAASVIPRTRISGAPPVASQRTATPVVWSPSAPAASQDRMFGGTTSQPISSDRSGEESVEIPRSSASRIVVPAVALVALLGIGGFVATKLHAERSPESAQPGPSSPSPPTTSMLATASEPEPLPTPRAATAAAPPAPVVLSPLAPTRAAPAPAAHARPISHPASPVATPAAAPPPTPAAPPAAKPDCDPPYVIDAAGHRQYKPECLK
jgi:eukaryotic-like serine/threonine-protein kinase